MKNDNITDLQRIDLESLKDENIIPKEDFPYVWKVGNKHVSFTDIKTLYNLAKVRVEKYESEIK